MAIGGCIDQGHWPCPGGDQWIARLGRPAYDRVVAKKRPGPAMTSTS